jgi:hypothetical protein
LPLGPLVSRLAPCYRATVPRRRDHRPSYTLDQVVQILGLRRPQLRGLLERRVIAPSVSRGRRGPGGDRRFNRCDLVAIRSGHELIRLGVVGARLRRVCQHIRRIERSGIRRALLLVTHAGDALHVLRARDLVRLVQRADGPYGHVVLDLRRVSRDVGRLLRGDGTPRRRR